MTPSGFYTRSEILSQPEAWAAALEVLKSHQKDVASLTKGGYEQVIFTGCGSPYYLSLSAAALWNGQVHQLARALPSSELWHSPDIAYAGKKPFLLVAVSRSGETTEIIRASQLFLENKLGKLLTISCYPDSTLSRLGDLNIVLPSGMEESVAQTRAFSTLFLAATALVGLQSGLSNLWPALERLPGICHTLLSAYAPLAAELGQDPRFDRFYFLGSGTRYGLASELSLKMKEMSLSHSEPFHFMEYRHGPKSMVTSSTLITGLVSQSNHKNEQLVLDEMHSMGASILSMHETSGSVVFNSQIDEALRDILYLPIGQLVALEHSLAKGLNPDRPENLTAVVHL